MGNVIQTAADKIVTSDRLLTGVANAISRNSTHSTLIAALMLAIVYVAFRAR